MSTMLHLEGAMHGKLPHGADSLPSPPLTPPPTLSLDRAASVMTAPAQQDGTVTFATKADKWDTRLKELSCTSPERSSFARFRTKLTTYPAQVTSRSSLQGGATQAPDP